MKSVRSLHRLLEDFYFRSKPLGIAFVTSASTGLSFGRPCNFVLPMLGSTEGLTEFHLENWGACVFASNFGRGRFLIAQFPLSPEDSPTGLPGSFVRLAAAVQQHLENPSGSSEPSNDSFVHIPKDPGGLRPKSRGAHAPLKEEPEP